MSGSVSPNSQDFPITSFLLGRQRPLLAFSDISFLDGNSLRSRDDFLDNEILELRGTTIDEPQFLGTPGIVPCPAPPSSGTTINSMFSGDPSVTQMPQSVGLFLIATNQVLSESVLTEHSLSITSNVATLVVNNDVETNFDWLLRPNLLRRSTGVFVAGGNSYTITRDVPLVGDSTIVIQDVSLPDGVETVRPIGYTMAFIDAFTAAQIDPGTPARIEFVFSFGPPQEVSF